MELLAQFNPPAQGGGDLDSGALMMIFLIYGGVFVVAIGIQILFLMSLSKCLKQIAPRNRTMEPGQVWLNLIPLFNIVWQILTIIRIAESLQNEYDSRGLRGDGDFGKTLGIIYFVSAFICGCVSIVCFIMYWSKIAGYTRQLSMDRGLDRDSGERRRSGDEEW